MHEFKATRSDAQVRLSHAGAIMQLPRTALRGMIRNLIEDPTLSDFVLNMVW